jgi:hypothetical protein
MHGMAAVRAFAAAAVGDRAGIVVDGIVKGMAAKRAVQQQLQDRDVGLGRRQDQRVMRHRLQVVRARQQDCSAAGVSRHPHFRAESRGI